MRLFNTLKRVSSILLALSLFLGAEAGAAVPSRVLSVPVMRNPAPLTPALRLAEHGQGAVSAHAWAVRLEAPSSIGEGPTANAPGDPEQEALSLYQRGLLLQQSGRLAEAAAVYDQVLQAFPGTQAASRATLMLLELRQERAPAAGPEQGSASPTGAQPATAGAGAQDKQDRLSRQGRAEFLVSESLMAGYAGFWVAMGLNDGQNLPLITASSAGLGLLVASQVAPRTRMTSAQAAQIRTIQLLGILNTVGYWGVRGPMGGLDLKHMAASSLIGLGASTLAAGFLHQRLNLTEGQVALVTSSILWTPFLVQHALVLAGTDLNLDPGLRWKSLAAGADLGVAATLLTLQSMPVKLSRSRMALINLGGISGLALAGTLLVLLDGTGSPQLDSTVAILGGVGGLAAGVLATRGWDEAYHPDVLASSSTPSVLAWENGALSLGQALPSLAPEVQVRSEDGVSIRTMGARIHVDLLKGQF